MAKLVSARCPQCGANVSIDPDREWVTCNYCRTSSFVQTPKRQPTQQFPNPVIYVKPGPSVALVVVPIIVAVAMIGIGTSVAVVAMKGASDAIVAVTSPIQADPRPGLTTPVITQPPAVKQPMQPELPQVTPFTNPEGVRKIIADGLGEDVELLDLVLYETYAIFQARDPKKPDNVDRYTVRNGELGAPSPVQLSSQDKAGLKARAFKLKDTNLQLATKLVQDAQARLSIEDAKVSHVMLRSNLPFSKDVVWRVYASSARESGSVEYKLDGTMRRVYK
jgi:DNA-directed RNA polymerase subunit RPC12/RpoP